MNQPLHLSNRAALSVYHEGTKARRCIKRPQIFVSSCLCGCYLRGNSRGIVEGLVGLAQVAGVVDETAAGQERAAALLSFATAHFAALGAPMWPPDRQDFERARTRVRARLTDAQYAAASERGAALTLEQALAEALPQKESRLHRRYACALPSCCAWRILRRMRRVACR